MKLARHLYRIKLAILKRYWQISGRILLNSHEVKYQSGIRLYGFPIIKKSKNSNIKIGKDVVLCSDSRFTDLGISKPTILRTLKDHAKIEIGDRSGLSGTTICAMKSISIGAECLIGADVSIFDTDFHPISALNRRNNNDQHEIKSEPVVIEENVFIGTGSIIMKGVLIGKNSIIGAGSVVNRSIPENSIAAGNPCKVIRTLD